MNAPITLPGTAAPRYARALASALLLTLTSMLTTGCQPGTPGHLQGSTMGTYWKITVHDRALLPDLRARVEARLLAINGLMSTYDPDSLLSQINAAAAGQWIPVDDELLQVLYASEQLSRMTGGAFDVTVGPLVNLWGFGPGDVQISHPPSAQQILQVRQMIGWQHLQLRQQPAAVRKMRNLYVDLSAIAKGYAVDEIAELLEARQVTDYLVDIGGELRAAGHNPRGQPWQVGVQLPQAGSLGEAREIIGLSGHAVATSGDYRNFFEYEDMRYSHTIDPNTGYPVSHGVASVTVIHPSAMWADGWATALNVLGPEAGLALAAEQGLPVLFMLGDEETFRARMSGAWLHWRGEG